MTQWYMIRDSVTGKHLPARSGYSYSATTVELTLDKPPRLFTKQGAARQAANCWQRGMITPTNPRNVSFLKGSLQVEDTWVKGQRMHVHEVPDRKLAKLEIVPVDIVPMTN